MNDYHVGDWVTIIMRPDKKVFEGIVDDFDQWALYVNGQGFPWDDILVMDPNDGT
jgi:hypothetical protein